MDAYFSSMGGCVTMKVELKDLPASQRKEMLRNLLNSFGIIDTMMIENCYQGLRIIDNCTKDA